MRWLFPALCALTFATLLGTTPLAAASDGAGLYNSRCAICHDSKPQPRMPSRAEIAARTPEQVVEAMSKGVMMTQASGLSEEERRAIATYITGKALPETDAQPTAGLCHTSPKPLTLEATDWNGWGVDTNNSRYQPDPGLKPEDVPRLKLKWAFGFPAESTAFAQPVIAGGRVFVGSAGRKVYSLDASSGCTYWSYSPEAPVRSAITIAQSPVLPSRWILYFGDLKANAYAIDAETGAEIWKAKVDDHPAARVTGSPTYYKGRLYVPVSSIEELFAASPKYGCCTFRGSVVALDGKTGRQIWKAYTVADPPKPYRTNKDGVQLFGPAGAAVWSAPTIDPKRGAVYAATGNSYTSLSIPTSDSILAFDLNSGSLKWASQAQPNDNFVVGCPKAVNCPKDDGPDYDFGAAPILASAGGRQILIAGQKSGVVYGLDPDSRGKTLWHTRLGQGGPFGGVEWGLAADNENTYVAISDRRSGEKGTPGVYALRMATGDRLWSAPAPKEPGAPGMSAAVSVMPGVVFAGSLNGHFRAYSTKTGEIIWEFNTAQPFQTVNNVTAKGGSIDSAGLAIAHGMVVTNSGYSAFGGLAGNVLLAFSVDGK